MLLAAMSAMMFGASNPLPAGANPQAQTVPSEPLNVEVAAYDSAASVSWSLPLSDGGSPITRFTVTSTPEGKSCVTPDGMTNSCLVTDLTNGVAYTFVVVATNNIGDSVPSAPSASETPYSFPTSPSITSVVGQNGGVDVSWTPPVSSNGRPISSYTVTSAPEAKTCTTPDGATTSCTVLGLTNGFSYTFTVVATNEAGSSDPSSPSLPVKPFTVPNAPSDVTGFPGMGSATLSWSAPTFNGGSSITAYHATASPGGATCASRNGSATGCTIYGLTNGVTYTFTVTATNLAGTSTPSDPSSPLVLTIPPSPPTQLVATPGNTEVSVSWTPPLDDGGASIDSFSVTAFASGGAAAGSCTTPDGLTTTCLVTGLVNGTTYTFSVVATNVAGSSLASVPSDPSIPFTSPGAPTGLSVTPGDRSVTVTWSAPLSSGGFPITGYTVTASPGGQTCLSGGATTTCTVQGLTNGQAYTFVVSSTTGHGSPSVSPSSPSTTPYTLPGAPTNVVAQAADGQLVVSWTAPGDDGGNAVSSYTATAWTSQKASAGSCTTADGSTTGCTISGLTNGEIYTVSVVATNLAGSSVPSVESAGATPFTTPGAPTSVAVTAGNTTIAVSWVAPLETGGLSLIGYTVVASPGGASCGPQDASSTGCTILGLTNGVHYSVVVTAINFANVATSAPPSASTAPFTVPDTPTGLRVTVGNGRADIAWIASVSDGGNAIQGYRVTASPGGATCTTIDGTTTGCSIFGLRNGSAYQFQVVAFNLAGDSTASAFTLPVTPFTMADPPTNVVVKPGNGSAAISWTAPLNDGGSPISGYTASATPVLSPGLSRFPHGSAVATCTTPNASVTSCTITGLSNGQSYTFSVQSNNGAGSSSSSVSSPLVTPSAPSSAPTNVAGTGTNGAVIVTWLPPTATGGTPIQTSVVVASPGGATCTTAVAPSTTCTVSGLSNGVAYSFTVTAVTGAGPGATSAPSAQVVPFTTPNAPLNVQATAKDGAALVSWTAGPSGGLPFSGFTATAMPGGLTCTTVSALSCTIQGLTNGTPTTFTVVATTNAGSSPPSVTSLPVTPFGIPFAPTITGTKAANGAVAVTWSLGASNGAPLDRTTVTAFDSQGVATSACSVVPPTATCVVVGLINGVTYSFSARSHNAAGWSSASSGTSSAMPIGPPDPPATVDVSLQGDTALVSWTPPPADNGSTISGYTVTAIDASGGTFGSCSVVGSDVTSCVIVGLDAGQHYLFRVVAHSQLGASAPATVGAQLSSAAVTVKYAPAQHPKKIAGILAGLAAIAATAAAAAGVGGGLAGGLGAEGEGALSGTPTEGESVASERAVGSERTDEHEGEREKEAPHQIEVHHHHVSLVGEGIGDRSLTWQLPGLLLIDRLGTKVPTSAGRYSSLAQGSFADGAYLRAMFGSASMLLIALAIVLAPALALQNHFGAVPAGGVLFGVLLAIGLFDAAAGAIGVAVYGGLALATGHVDSYRSLLGLLLIGTLWAALPVMISHLRPFHRDIPTSLHAWWLRIGDHVLTPFFAFYLTSKLIDALPGLTGLNLPIVSEHQAFGFLAAGVVFARLLLEDVALWLYPRRTALSRIDPVPTTARADAVGIVIRSIFMLLVGEALVGNVWQVWALVPIYVLYALAPRLTKSFPRVTWVYRFAPKTLPKFGVLVLTGQVLAVVLTRSFHLGAQDFLGWDLLLLLTTATILKYLEGFKGDPWPKTWMTRLAGAILAVATILLALKVISIH